MIDMSLIGGEIQLAPLDWCDILMMWYPFKIRVKCFQLWMYHWLKKRFGAF